MSTVLHTKSLDTLPHEIQFHTLSYLDTPQWIVLSKTNSLYRQLSSDDFLWTPRAKEIIQRMEVDDPQLIRVFCSNWKQTYILARSVRIKMLEEQFSQLQRMAGYGDNHYVQPLRF
jgi:hypothetical protein